MAIGRGGYWTKWLLAEVAIGRNGYWPKWSLDEVVMDEMAVAEMVLGEMAIAQTAYTKNKKSGHYPQQTYQFIKQQYMMHEQCIVSF